MKLERGLHSVEFYTECAKYIEETDCTLKECADHFGVKYATLKQNLVKLGLRKPNRSIPNKPITFDEHYFDIIDSDEKAYFLGLLMSDGYICKTPYSYSMGIALQLSDEYIIQRLHDVMQSKASISYYKNSVKVVFNGSEHLYNTLVSYGFNEDKSHSDYKVPNIPEDYFNGFVRGYFDGDGCITNKASGYSVSSICCNSKVFLEDLRAKLSKYVENIRPITTETGKRKNPLYVMYISTKQNQQQFKDFLYQNAGIKLIRKYDKFMAIPC